MRHDSRTQNEEYVASASRRGQALIELLVGTALALAFLAALVNLTAAGDRALGTNRFRTKEKTQWIDSRNGSLR